MFESPDECATRDISEYEGMQRRSVEFEKHMSAQLEEAHINMERLDNIVAVCGRERQLWEQLAEASKRALTAFDQTKSDGMGRPPGGLR
jgi:protein-tyrosine-phosphatase